MPAIDRALLEFARKLTLEPAAMNAADVERLRAHGLSDEQVSHTVQVVALFNYYNRIADGLGIRRSDDALV